MHTHLSLVNQKMGFATAILAVVDDISAEVATSKQKLRQQATCESVLLHLYTAFHFYLRELAENNGIKNPENISSLQTLVTALDQLGKQPSEVIELQDLVVRDSSWLNMLLQQHEHIFKSPPKKIEKKAFGTESMIELVDLTRIDESPNTELGPALLKAWIAEFKALILRQRETGAEY